jgi:hypothetical protein
VLGDPRTDAVDGVIAVVDLAEVRRDQEAMVEGNIAL